MSTGNAEEYAPRWTVSRTLVWKGKKECEQLQRTNEKTSKQASRKLKQAHLVGL